MNQGTEGDSQGGNPSAVAPVPVRFTGSGAEYFGIWIVNLLLTIVTIGIYSAWAKVRRLQYFYRHTELAGSSFDFHGSPIKILIGRLVALVMLIAYNYTVRIQSVWTLAVVGGIGLIMPWLLRNSLRFRLFNTSWRGVRFHFRGTVGRAYRVFLLYGILSFITLYILAPFMHQRVKAYQHNNSWFGKTQCSFHAGVGQFYKIYLLLLAAIAAFAILAGVSGVFGLFVAATEAQKHGGRVNPYDTLKALVMLYGITLLVVVSIGPVFRALIANLIWSNTRVGEHRIECNMSPLGLIWITFSNLVLIVLTLGLFIPWASVRMAKFQLEAVRLIPAGDLQQFVDAEPDKIGAVGVEAASAFDFDISL
jgi:uncharacterized membrane protein YjgN (DUF898 family)